MIFVLTQRHGLICTAATTHADLRITIALGLTQEAARRRLHRKLDRVERWQQENR